MTSRDTGTTLLAGLLLVSGGRAAAQDATDPAAAGAALEQCTAAAQGGREQEARPAADRAEAMYERWMQASPRDPEPRVGLAAVKSRCRIPFAEMMQQGALIAQSNQLLEEALALDSLHWRARFSLAMNHYHTPAFLGRTGDAARHLEVLVAQQGERAEPHFALPYLYLGDLYRRLKRDADARAVWERGARLFAGDARFAERLAGRGEGGDAPPAAPAGPVSSASSSGGALALAPLVADGGNRLEDTRSGTSLRRLDVLTTPGGTADVMHAFQTMPGATRAAEGSDLYVRGGDPAETPVFVDGARLVYPGRYESLNGSVFGILDSQVLRSAYFASGGFSARYGDALSGVLDLETNGRPEVRTARVNANTVQLGTALDLPLGRRTGGWASVRATDSRLLLAMHGRSGDFAQAPSSLEGIVGATWEPRAGTQLRLTALADGDRSAREVDAYGWQGAFRSRGTNRLAALSARTVSADGSRALRGSLSAAVRENGYAYGVLDRLRTDRGVRGRVDGDLAWGEGRVRAGAEGAWMDAREAGSVPTSDLLAPGSPSRELEGGREQASHLGAYVEAERPLGSSVAVVAGVRADRLPGEAGWTVDPRLALAVRASEWTLRLGGGLFHQGRWRTRYALPSAGSPSGTPREAAHLVLGAERGGEPSVKVEAFWKQYGGYVPAGDGPQIAAGRAAGVDAIVRWSRQARLNGWITYSYLDGRLELRDGRAVPSAVDVRHSLTGVARLTLPHSWELGATARLATGKPFTAIDGSRDGAPVYGAPHGARMPDYSRLDGRITRYLPMRAGVGVVYLEMLNLLDRHNVQAYTYGA
ncbi:MAG TPA: hypothetical protein VEW03_13625, partial [Longimicrobiaceae bacterium]|nr:hypothetical protein [Longimicrobiaceae bacterium]